MDDRFLKNCLLVAGSFLSCSIGFYLYSTNPEKRNKSRIFKKVADDLRKSKYNSVKSSLSFA